MITFFSYSIDKTYKLKLPTGTSCLCIQLNKEEKGLGQDIIEIPCHVGILGSCVRHIFSILKAKNVIAEFLLGLDAHH